MTSEKYHIIKKIGEGGMATVFEAVERVSGQKVAVKILNSNLLNDKDISLRFENEATATMMLKHPNIAGAYDYTEIEGKPAIVMELVKGISLTDLVNNKGAIPKEQAVKYMMQILSAIDFVHKKGIIHRDLKPSNILISAHNQIKIIDFGIAKFHNGISLDRTIPGTVIGTYMYMSPQQVKGKNVDNLTDVYALGAVFYYMLSGQHPYIDAVGEYDVQSCVVNKPIPDVKYPDMNSIIQKATQKDPKYRFMSCDEFARTIVFGINNVAPEPTTLSSHPDIILTIGRSNSNDIILPKQEISRKHAQLSINISQRNYTIIDLDSTSGSYVNGKRINGAYRLNQDDKVVFADTVFPWKKYVLKAQQDATLVTNNNVEGNSFITGNEYQEEAIAQGFLGFENSNNTNDYEQLSLFDYYKKTMSKYNIFYGRATNKEFWSYILFLFLFYLSVFTLFIILTNTVTYTGLNKYTIIRFTIILSSLFFIIHFLPFISISARRLNDVNGSD